MEMQLSPFLSATFGTFIMQETVLDVTPQWLLSGIEAQGDRGNPQKWFAIDAGTRVGRLVTEFNRMDSDMQERLLGYAEALGAVSKRK